MGMVRQVAANTVPAREMDDAIQDGMVAAWRAEASWEPDGGCPLRLWVYMKVRHAVIDGRRARTGFDKRKRIPRPLSVQLPESLTAPTTDDPEHRALLVVAFGEFRRTLSPADLDLVDALLSGETGRDYAARIGVDESRISQRLKVLRQRLHRYI